jgi:DNA repair exonuclease SbcCD ATPase subunit
MSHRHALASLTCLTLLSAPAFAQDGEKITYEDQVRPLLENKCFSCHNPDKKKGDLDLTSMGALMTGGGGGAIVDSGNPSSSRLWTSCAKKEEPFMPPEGAALSAKELDILSKWIAGGVLETKSSVAKKSSKPKVDMAVAVTSGKPAGPIAKPEHVLLEPVVVTPRTTAVIAMAASPWTSLVAFAAPKQVLLYDTDTKQLAGIFPYTEGYARSLRFSRNGSLLVMGGGRGGKLGHAIVWDVKTGKRIVEVGKEFDQVMCADISPDHKMVVIGSPSKKVKVYDTATGEELYVISKHTEWVMGTAFSPDGVLLATSDRNGNVMVWEAASGGEFYILGQHKATCTDLAWRGDSNILASCSMDGTINIWEMNEGKLVKSWAAHSGGVQSVSFTPEGNLVSVGNDGLVRLWDINGNKKSEAVSQGDIVTKVVALHDSKSCVSANWRGEVKMLSLEAKMADWGSLSSNPPLITQRIIESEKRATELVAKMPSLQDAIKKAEADVKTREERLAKTRAEVAENERRSKSYPAEIAADEKALAEAKAALTKATADKTARTAALKAHVDKSAQLAALQKELDSAAAEVAKLTAAKAEPQKIAPIKAKADQLTAAVAKAKTALGAAPAPVADLDKLIADTTAKVKTTTEAIAAKKAESPKLPALVKAGPDRIKAAEAALAQDKGVLVTAQTTVKFASDEIKVLQKLPTLLKAAQFNVGVLTEKEKLAKLEGSFNDYTAAKKENEDAKVNNAARIESAKKTVAETTNAIPQHEATLNKLKAELNGIEQAVTPTKAADSSAAGKLDAHKKSIAAREAELAALTKTRDDGIAAAKKSADDIGKASEGLKKKLTEVAAKLKGPAAQVVSKQANVSKIEPALAAAKKSVADLTPAVTAKEKAFKDTEASLPKLLADTKTAEKALADAKAAKDKPADLIAKAQADLDARRAAKAAGDKAFSDSRLALGKVKSELTAAVNAVAQTEKKLAQARTELATADKAAAPLRGQHDSISKEITAQDKARAEKLAAPAALAAEFVTKSKSVTDAIAQLKAAQPALDKAFADARAKLEGEIKIVDAKKAEVTKATEEIENTKKKKATAETTIAASLKDNPVRDKNLVEINAELTKLQPQLDPLRAKVKQLESQYFTMLPK